MTMQATILKVLEAHDGLAMDNAKERQKLALALAKELTEPGVDIYFFCRFLNEVPEQLQGFDASRFVKPVAKQLARMHGWDVENAERAEGSAGYYTGPR